MKLVWLLLLVSESEAQDLRRSTRWTPLYQAGRCKSHSRLLAAVSHAAPGRSNSRGAQSVCKNILRRAQLMAPRVLSAWRIWGTLSVPITILYGIRLRGPARLAFKMIQDEANLSAESISFILKSKEVFKTIRTSLQIILPHLHFGNHLHPVQGPSCQGPEQQRESIPCRGSRVLRNGLQVAFPEMLACGARLCWHSRCVGAGY